MNVAITDMSKVSHMQETSVNEDFYYPFILKMTLGAILLHFWRMLCHASWEVSVNSPHYGRKKKLIVILI